MGKIIILVALICLLTSLPLYTIVYPRLILQQLVLDDCEIVELVSNTGISHSDLYQIEALLIVDDEVIATVNSEDDETPVRALRIVLSGADTDNPRVIAIIDQSAFPMIWPTDSILRINIIYTENEESAIRDITIPSGFGPIYQLGEEDQMIVPPYNLDATEENNIPYITHLKWNYPNPFNPETIITFSLNKEEPVSIIVYDIRGRRVKTLVDKDQFTAGEHRIIWDGTNERGEAVASGIYFYKMQTEGFSSVRKMSLIN